MSGIRFTTWLSESERDAIHQRATEQNTSDNYIIRMAIRAYLGMDNRTREAETVVTGNI